MGLPVYVRVKPVRKSLVFPLYGNYECEMWKCYNLTHTLFSKKIDISYDKTAYNM